MLDKHPENALNNLVYFELGNYYFDNNKFKRAAGYYAKTDISGLSEEKTDEMNFKMGYSFLKQKRMIWLNRILKACAINPVNTMPEPIITLAICATWISSMIAPLKALKNKRRRI